MKTKPYFIFLLGILLITSQTSKAQKFGLDYTSEFQTDFKNNYNFLNLLKLEAEINITNHLSFQASTISTAKTNEEKLVDDFQGFSNIEIENIPLALAVANFQWKINENNSIYLGVRNMNEDYFVSDVTSFFTNSSGGIFPTIGANYPIANYPVASMGVHYSYESENLGIQASVYNGTAYRDFFGKESVFRFSPKNDGIFAASQVEYKHKGSNYFLGACLHYGELDEIEEPEARASVWAYAEQKIIEDFYLIGAYSLALHSSSPCNNFAGVGGKLNVNKWEAGVLATYCKFQDIKEWCTEISIKYNILENCYIQPTIHFINPPNHCHTIGLLRIGVNI